MIFTHRTQLKAFLFILSLSSPFLLQAASDSKSNIISQLTCKDNNAVFADRCKMFYLGKTVVGSIVFGKCPEDESIGFIHRLRTHEDFRGKGVGSYMLTTIIQILKDEGCKAVQLEASPFETDSLLEYLEERKKLIKFYEKHGFHVIERKKAIMQKPLS